MNQTQKTRIAVAGAAGRMGRRLCALCVADPKLELIEAIDIGAAVGKPAAEGSHVTITDKFAGNCDVLIDFATPAATRANLAKVTSQNIGMVIGTTGLTDADQLSIDAAGKTIPIIQATNFSLVVNVLTQLAAQAAKLLGPDYDIEIVETHHRFKKDAPSGTALSIAQAVCDATNRSFKNDVVFERHGHEAMRKPNEITIQAVRLGDVVGEHTVYFGTIGERMELRHVGTSRDSYASGALRAAAWLHRQKAGRYTMADVLGLK
ncbi:MAG: 4-hydroxy-tetrahydrodipicolinate reductase [Phycisphaeraceae bacterium]